MRAGRLLSLVLALQGGGRVTARELATQLGVSERTVLRDIEVLSGSGVPVYAVRGANGGFELLDTFQREVPPLPAGLSGGQGRLRRVRVRLSPGALQLALLFGKPEGWRPRPGQRAREEDDAVDPAADPTRADWIEGSFRFDSWDGAVRELLAIGPDVEVVLPVELRATMAEVGHRLVDLHRRSDEQARVDDESGDPAEAASPHEDARRRPGLRPDPGPAATRSPVDR